MSTRNQGMTKMEREVARLKRLSWSFWVQLWAIYLGEMPYKIRRWWAGK